MTAPSGPTAPSGLTVGLIGFGSIGKRLTRLLADRPAAPQPTAVLLRPGSASQAAAAAAGLTVVHDLDALLAAVDGPVVECAGHGALAGDGPRVLARGRDLILVSVGALADPDLDRLLQDAAAGVGAGRLLPVPGAVGGIDALAAMRLAGLSRVTYRGRKPPSGWRGSPAEDTVDLDRLETATPIFRGTAREAAATFPKNANVAATVALAGLGWDATSAELIADPAVTRNVHEIEAEGESGRFTIRLEGLPDPDNPRTSALTGLSLARAVINLTARVAI